VEAIVAGQVGLLVRAHQDRLARFGDDLLAHLCRQHRCTLLVLHQETLSPEQEMVQDLLTIVYCFARRRAGGRHYRKTLKEALKADAPSAQDPAQSNA
jgi:predicted site-specific integrase-resolvase